MNQIFKFLKYLLLIIVAFTFNQCEDDESATPKDNPTVELAAPTSPGHGQYRLGVESGNEVSIPITITSTNNLKSFQVTKTVNLAVDSSFATNGVMDLLTGTAGQTYEYTFLYRPSVNDVDQLVGFTFKAEDQGGSVTEGDRRLRNRLLELEPSAAISVRRPQDRQELR
jgi:hypothetical protein